AVPGHVHLIPRGGQELREHPREIGIVLGEQQPGAVPVDRAAHIRGPVPPANRSSRAIRSAIGGCVENSDARPCPRKGLAIIRWLWVTSRSSCGSGSAVIPPSILRSADASARGSCESSAPER